MKLVISRNNLSKSKGDGKKLTYKDPDKVPKGADVDHTTNAGKVAYVTGTGTEEPAKDDDKDEKVKSKKKDEKEKPTAEEGALPQPQKEEEVVTTPSTSVKMVPPSVTAQTGLSSTKVSSEHDDVASLVQQIESADHETLDPAQLHEAAAKVKEAGYEEQAKKLTDKANKVAKKKQSKQAVEAVEQANKPPKKGKAPKEKEPSASDVAKEIDYTVSYQSLSGYMDDLKSKVDPGSKESKLLDEYSKLLDGAHSRGPSTMSSIDFKAAANVVNSIRAKVATDETEVSKKLLAHIEHAQKLDTVHSRITEELGNTVDPVKKKQLELHLDRLQAQMKAKPGEVSATDKTDLAQADRDHRSIQKQNIKDKEEAPKQEAAAKEAADKKAAREKADKEKAESKAKTSSEKKAAADKKAAEKQHLNEFQTKNHKAAVEQARTDILNHLSGSKGHIDKKDYEKLLNHFKVISSHKGVTNLTGKEKTELSQAQSALKSSKSTADKSKAKQASQQKAANKKLVVRSSKTQKHAQSVKDTLSHIESAKNALPADHPLREELDRHVNQLKSQKPGQDGYSEVHRKELMSAYSAAEKAHRESSKTSKNKEEKAEKPEKVKFFSESPKAGAAKTSVSNAAGKGKAFGNKLASAVHRKEVAPTGETASGATEDAVSKLLSRTKSSEGTSSSTVSSKTEEKKKDTEKVKKSFTLVNDEAFEILLNAEEMAKSMTGSFKPPLMDTFEKKTGTKLGKLTGYTAKEYYEFIQEALQKSIEDLNV
jgi:hypothetical protein